MERKTVEPSEVSLAYDIFAPLWGLLQLGAVREWDGASAFRPLFLEFVTARRDSLARLLTGIQAVADLSDDTMAIFEKQGGWSDDDPDFVPDQLGASLLMYSGFVAEYPLDFADADTVRRVIDAGTDLQLVNLLQGLVGAALVRGPEVRSAASLVAESMGIAAEIIAVDAGPALANTVRSWRIAHLAPAVRPDSNMSEARRARLRALALQVESSLVVSRPDHEPGR
ncbi:hypothetical protein AB0B57_35935 [Micromonospora sp. NPDC049101]|uniref:hypothetical protein n=1 Tax=Micromonospora sp. NPDC049101 TaxID=3155032 RepID=UPI0033CD3155